MLTVSNKFVYRLIAVESDILQNVLTRLKYCEEEEKVVLHLYTAVVHVHVCHVLFHVQIFMPLISSHPIKCHLQSISQQSYFGNPLILFE